MQRALLAALFSALSLPALAQDESVSQILAKYPPPGVRPFLVTEVTLPPMSVSKAQAAAIVATEAKRQGVPVPLALAITHQESGFQPRVKSYQNAFGLMQVIPPTARLLGYTGPVQGLYDPYTSARLGVTYLKQGIDEGGIDWAIVRYHGGPDTRQHGRKTRAYHASVKRLYAAYARGTVQ